MPRITVTIESSDGSRVTFDGAAGAAYGSTEEELHAALMQDAEIAVTQYIALEKLRTEALLGFVHREMKSDPHSTPGPAGPPAKYGTYPEVKYTPSTIEADDGITLACGCQKKFEANQKWADEIQRDLERLTNDSRTAINARREVG